MAENSEINKSADSDNVSRKNKLPRRTIYGRLINFLKWFSVLLFLLLFSLFFLFRSHGFQTWAGQKVSAWLSDELNTIVSIQRLEIDFFSRVNLRGVYIQDLKKDTLLYGESLILNIKDFNLSEKKMEIGVCKLDNIKAKLIKYKNDKDFNFQFLADYFTSTDTVKSEPSNFKIKYGDLVLSDFSFAYIDYNDTSKTSGMNFSNLELTDLNGVIKKIKIKEDEICLDIRGLQLKEKSGFELRKLNTDLKISPSEISMENLELITGNSSIFGKLKTNQKDYESFTDFINKVKINADLKNNSVIGSRDIVFFVPDLNSFSENLKLSGNFSGEINNLKGKNVFVGVTNQTRFAGNFHIKNVTQSDSMYSDLEIKELTTSASDLINIGIPGMSLNDRKAAFTPILPLGNTSYNGKISGYLNDLNVDGKISTQIGSIDLNAEIFNLTNIKNLKYNGKFDFNQIQIGKFSNQKDLGSLTGMLDVKGGGSDLNSLDIDFNGEIKSVGFRNYEYQNLSMHGALKKRKFEGTFELKDKHADIFFKGVAGLQTSEIELDFVATINKLEFNKINLASPNDSIHDLSSNLQIKLSGNNIDNFSGRIDVSNSVYHLNGKKYKLKDFNLFLDQKQEQKSINLASSIADINVDGKFNISDLQNSFRQYLEKYFPTLIREKRIPKGKVFTDHFNYSITINNFSLINGLFLPDLIVGKGTEISGNYDASKSELSLKGSSKKIQFKDFKINDWTVAVNSLSQSIEINTGARRLFLSDSLYVTNFNFNSSSFDNQSGFHLNWDNNGNKKYSGDIAGSVNFLNSNIQLGLTKMDLTVNDSLWALKDTTDFIKIDTTGKIVIQRLTLRNNSQMLKIDGAISNLPNEDLIVEVDNFKISQFNPVLSSAGLKFDGVLDGKAKLSRVNEKIVFSSEFSFTDFFLNDRLMGNGNVRSIYNTEKDFISINGFFKKTNNTSNLTNVNNLNAPVTVNNIEFNGYYYPSRKENNIDLSVVLSKLDIAIIQPYLKDILSFPSMQGGALNGKVSVKGSVSKPLLEGRLLVNIKNLKVDYLNTFYNATGIVHIDSNKVCLGDEAPENGEAPSPIFLFDREGHTATVWGNIFHDNFKITKLDFDINTNNFMVLNTTPKNNPDYFGKAYVTGSVGIYGSLDQMNMEINLKTEKNTEFNIPLSGPATVEENNFIIFLNKDTTKKNSNVYQKSLSGINLDLNLEATPDANVKMIFDSKSGDVISARGNGNIKMVINTNGKFEMYGLYTLTNGDYMFSLENILSKKFEIISGSTVKWAGDPLNADINITAGYNQNSSLTPFFPSDSTGRYSKPVKASVLLNMNGKLMNPDIGFGVSLPSVDETTRQTVLSYLNNEQEMNRQVFSLLLLKSFVTPLQLSNQGVGLGAGSTASRTSSEMLSNQLSNWLSQLNTGVDISVNITPEQMDVALSKQLFNDRLSIDGNVGVNNSAGQKTSNMIGDIQVDYKVYPDGKLRLKGFNKSNDNTQISTLGGPFTQGMGIYYKEEFNTVNELYDKYLGWMKKKKKKDN